MKVTILIIISALGLLLPLFWIIGTVTSVIYFCIHRERETAALDTTRQAVAFNPQLGLTMADGGDAIDKEKKEGFPRDDGSKPIRNERRK